ncbi:MAG: hypothetical protein ACM3ME_08405 [Chloroflexota bacterium]|nr:hypothetical protein [Lentimicrobium sp.]
MKSMIRKILYLFFFLLILSSCKEYENYPAEPKLELIEFTLLRDAQGIDQRGIMHISYTDGDGNIGLYKYDTVPPYDYNLFVKYFEQQNGVFKEIYLIRPNYDDTIVTYDTATFNARIPLLTPAGRNKAIRGEIEDTLFVNNPLSTFDTIKFQAYIVDRDLNKSNVIETPPIVIKKR